MKIIKADWEKRNFDRDCYEIVFTQEDFNKTSTELIKMIKNEFKDAYKIVKIPVARIDFLHQLEDDGYRFMEDQLTVSLDFKSFSTPDKLREFSNSVEIIEVEKDGDKWKDVADSVTENMFHTDRIYLDPLFNPKISQKRYQNWINDLVGDINTHLLAFKYKENIIGFCLDAWINKEVYSILGGLFETYHHKGLGRVQYLNWLEFYKKMDMKKITTKISSNNINVLNIYMMFNFSIINQMYVLRKI